MQNDLSQFLASLVTANLALVLQVNAPSVEQEEQQQEAQPVSMTREERNHLVMSLLEQLTPLVRKYAAAYHLDFEDMYQEASIAIMRRLDAGISRRYSGGSYPITPRLHRSHARDHHLSQLPLGAGPPGG